MEVNSLNGGRGQLQAIQEMLVSGHASVRMERHTFILWGLAAGGLILLVPRLFSMEQFSDQTQRMWFQNAFISLVLVGVGVLDTVWTWRIRQRRDETLSFIQRQVTKLWWLLIALVVVINIGMNLYGGGYFLLRHHPGAHGHRHLCTRALLPSVTDLERCPADLTGAGDDSGIA